MRTSSTRFGSKIRALRQERDLGLRELARLARISPAFLSKIESGKERPPAEKKLKALARALGSNVDVLLALSGRLPTDVVRTIQKHPSEYVALIRDLRNLNARQLDQVRSRILVTYMDIPVSPEEMGKLRKSFRRADPWQAEIHFSAQKKSAASRSRSKHETGNIDEGEESS